MNFGELKQHLPTVDVWVANILALGITLTSVKDVLSITSLLIAIGYSLWRWRTDYKKGKKK